MTDNKALADRLRMHASDCFKAAYRDTDVALMPLQLDDMADALEQAATALTATPSAQAGEVPRYGRWHPVHGFEWSRAYETGGYPDKEWTTLCTTPQPQGDASPQPAIFCPPKPGNWTEDFSHENGQYECRCVTCDSTFYGHKRRVVCRLCATPRAHEPAPTADGGELYRALAAIRIVGTIDEYDVIRRSSVVDIMPQHERNAIHPAPQADVARLVEAARPFDALFQPDAVGHMDRRQPDAQGIYGVNGAAITLGDLRRLREALAPFTQSEGATNGQE